MTFIKMLTFNTNKNMLLFVTIEFLVCLCTKKKKTIIKSMHSFVNAAQNLKFQMSQ